MKRCLSTPTKPLGLLLIVSIFLVVSISCNQSSKSASHRPPGPDLPHMWMDQATSRAHEGNFLIFNRILKGSNSNKETDSIYFTISAFRDLITACGKLTNIAYLDIYPVVPPGGDTLFLLFVPKNAAYLPLAYYKLTANAPSFPQTGDILTKTVADDWQKNYHKRIGNLDVFLDPKDPFNYYNCKTDTTIWNTVYTSHYFSEFQELMSEITLQKSMHSVDITGIKAFFAAKPSQFPGTLYSLSNRLYVILEFTVDDPAPGTVYSVPDDGRYWPGPARRIAECPDEKGGNNGQMCPPTCNP